MTPFCIGKTQIEQRMTTRRSLSSDSLSPAQNQTNIKDYLNRHTILPRAMGEHEHQLTSASRFFFKSSLSSSSPRTFTPKTLVGRADQGDQPTEAEMEATAARLVQWEKKSPPFLQTSSSHLSSQILDVSSSSEGPVDFEDLSNVESASSPSAFTASRMDGGLFSKPSQGSAKQESRRPKDPPRNLLIQSKYFRDKGQRAEAILGATKIRRDSKNNRGLATRDKNAEMEDDGNTTGLEPLRTGKENAFDEAGVGMQPQTRKHEEEKEESQDEEDSETNPPSSPYECNQRANCNVPAVEPSSEKAERIKRLLERFRSSASK